MKSKLMAYLFMLSLFTSSPLVWANQTVQLEGVINVNEATVEQLMLLPGIGEKKAQEIIETRKVKLFESGEDLLAIKGIGEKMLERLGSHIAFSGKSTLKQVE